jgi:hypothetical protein
MEASKDQRLITAGARIPSPGRHRRARRRSGVCMVLTPNTETKSMATTNTNLTDNQRCVLRAASCSANLNVWPLPRKLNLNAGSAAIVVRGLLKKGLVEERPARGNDAVWRENEDGQRVTLLITKAGLAAVGMLPEIEAGRNSATNGPPQKAANAAQSGPTTAVSENQRRMPRHGTKLAALVGLLNREEGMTIEEMAVALGWQEHTVRGVMSGALVKKFGLTITSEKISQRGRVYRITGAAEACADEVDKADLEDTLQR